MQEFPGKIELKDLGEKYASGIYVEKLLKKKNILKDKKVQGKKRKDDEKKVRKRMKRKKEEKKLRRKGGYIRVINLKKYCIIE